MNDTIPARAGRREWIALAVLALPTLLVSIDVYTLFLALPDIGEAWARAASSSCGSPTCTGSCWPGS